MKIAICGGTGFVGSALTSFLLHKQYRVYIITRHIPDVTKRTPHVGYVTWEQLEADPELLPAIDAMINLAGETINQRWSAAAKSRILQSRLQATQRVANLVEAMQSKPRVVINASTIAIYGTSEEATYDEASPVRVTDFLAETVAKWEEAQEMIPATRLVKLRIGLVLGNEGGAFPLMRLPYLMGVGGRLGNGRQWFSWIHIQDLVRLIEYCLLHADIQGPVNATAPNPARNDEFGRILGQVYHRPHWMAVPAWLLQGILGDLSMLLLAGQCVLPHAALQHGFTFMFPTLKTALQDLKR